MLLVRLPLRPGLIVWLLLLPVSDLAVVHDILEIASTQRVVLNGLRHIEPSCIGRAAAHCSMGSQSRQVCETVVIQ